MKMKEPSRIFHGKVMLFGEYGVIMQGQALTVALRNFSAYLRFPDGNYDKNQLFLNQQLKEYLAGLLRLHETAGVKYGIDLNAFALDLQRGLFLESEIPQGYGAGSSGALVAAVYHRYAKKCLSPNSKPSSRQLSFLQKKLARLEGYFHGTSSGIDPLSCYLAMPLLIVAGKAPLPVAIPEPSFEKSGGFFLVNTSMPRKTESLVNRFLENYRQKTFKVIVEKKYLPMVDQCINHLLVADWSLLMSAMKKLSEIQYQHFSEMIPIGYEDLWRQGLENDLFTFKLCGAGGGGFILGYTTDYDQTNRIVGNVSASMFPIEIA